MTFEQFKATRKWCDDLSIPLRDAMWDGEPAKPCGWLYLDCLYVDQVLPHWPNNALQEGKWHLVLGRDEWITNDLESLERRLWEFAVDSGYADPITV